MKFFSGLLIGGVVTLLMATAIHVPTGGLVQQATAWWDELVLVTGKQLFALPRPGVSEVPTMHPVATVIPSDVDHAPAASAAGDPLEPSVGGQRAPTMSTQAVWVPFRSRMSADGFAQHLTTELDHVFSVDRRGPGRYQVVFSYASESERLALLDRMRTVTELEL